MNPSAPIGKSNQDLFIGYFGYWGKAGRGDTGIHAYHPLVYHSLDVAAVGHVWLESDPSLRKRLADNIRTTESVLMSVVSFFLALHDLGKFSEGFQNLCPDLFWHLRNRDSDKRYVCRHDSLGFLLWNDHVWERIWEEDWFHLHRETETPRQCRKALEPWARAVTGHHGEPPKEVEGLRLRVSEHFGEKEKSDAVAFTKDVADLLLNRVPCSDIAGMILKDDSRVAARRASWLLAGVAVLCDWLGSDEDHFPFRPEIMPLDDYWKAYALRGAKDAVHASGILPSRIAVRTGVTELFPKIKVPSPLQKYTAGCALSDGPQLFILEEATGAGKTEAALMLAHRLMAKGEADGVFIALPTMATANAMYDRVAEAYRRMFFDSETPSLVLAHSSRHLSDPFRESVLDRCEPRYSSDAENGLALCAAWLADNRKKAMLADVGVGTVDQVLLGILPSRHQSLRLLGLNRKVLVVDEVHSYDRYVLLLLRNLLRFHASLGGSAILLSATLPRSIRQQLVEGYCEGAGGQVFRVESDRYPLVTAVWKSGGVEVAVRSRTGTERQVDVRWVHDVDEAGFVLKKAADEGRCACWIRNTVADAIEGYEKLRNEIGSESLMLFHARFAMGDRLDIEKKVLEFFGTESTALLRRGKILVATQVVEQSLDLDFDMMVTDLAPIDMLIQRAGRLHRHSRDLAGNLRKSLEWKDGRDTPILHILSPSPDGEPGEGWYRTFFRRGAKVYPNHGQLWLTARLLSRKGGWRMPHDARCLIEEVYGEHAFDEIPQGLILRAEIAEGQDKANASVAMMNGLNLDDGYATTPGHWLDDTRAPTRLGDLTTTLRLARREGDSLFPWSGAERFAWDLSQVSVRSAWIKSEAIDPELQGEAQRVKESMPDRGRWSVMIPMSDLGSGVWKGQARDPAGNPVTVNYDKVAGLTIGR